MNRNSTLTVSLLTLILIGSQTGFAQSPITTEDALMTPSEDGAKKILACYAEQGPDGSPGSVILIRNTSHIISKNILSSDPGNNGKILRIEGLSTGLVSSVMNFEMTPAVQDEIIVKTPFGIARAPSNSIFVTAGSIYAFAITVSASGSGYEAFQIVPGTDTPPVLFQCTTDANEMNIWLGKVFSHARL